MRGVVGVPGADAVELADDAVACADAFVWVRQGEWRADADGERGGGWGCQGREEE